jgi:hypothetical protein
MKIWEICLIVLSTLVLSLMIAMISLKRNKLKEWLHKIPSCFKSKEIKDEDDETTKDLNIVDGAQEICNNFLNENKKVNKEYCDKTIENLKGLQQMDNKHYKKGHEHLQAASQHLTNMEKALEKKINRGTEKHDKQ